MDKNDPVPILHNTVESFINTPTLNDNFDQILKKNFSRIACILPYNRIVHGDIRWMGILTNLFPVTKPRECMDLVSRAFKKILNFDEDEYLAISTSVSARRIIQLIWNKCFCPLTEDANKK